MERYQPSDDELLHIQSVLQLLNVMDKDQRFENAIRHEKCFSLCDIFLTFQNDKHLFDEADVAFNISVYGKSGVHRAEAAD